MSNYSIAEIERLKLSDGSLVYNVIIRDGQTRGVRLECESFTVAFAIANAINKGVTGIAVLA